MKKVLFAVYTSPVGSIWINEAFRSAFGMYGEDLEPAVLFVEEAVLAVRSSCKPELIGCLPLAMTFKYIEKYQTPVYAVKEDLDKFNIKEDEIAPQWNLKIVSKDELPEFVHSFDKVVIF
ncbi:MULTISPECIES: DsrE family protein [Caldanaerobacter]|uniref:Intracellular sulfur oxidation protein n=2 Tax=Caldanaerobacter subterraneus TaxID=911092 RepID=A0A357VQ52_9THEO|nr:MULTISPECIES: DsrE family protein [Caldanaerobacter]ERM91811.1 intracellular sulfur oxidation protein [Caldanaerobacter subterraneus subsp. yonseiensis KB-1]MBE3578405.1 DsrE family protein [Caldanaerobacter subterraneus]MDI3519982.1 hypothetical protein [Caldanaerobacter sp.]MDK2794624.1 hypothetical protein [Caldanaerobacter sp.]NNG66590.1 intracellular sulfur oxidation protein [Caldanaerobacter subterraneus]